MPQMGSGAHLVTEHSMDSKSRFYALMYRERARLPSSRTRYATPVKKEYGEAGAARACARQGWTKSTRPPCFQREIPDMHIGFYRSVRVDMRLFGQIYITLAVHRCAEPFSADGFLRT
jgi:hypothetical protein